MRKGQTAIEKSKSINIKPAAKPSFISASTTLNMDIAVYPYDDAAADTRMRNLLNDAMSGKPLDRSKEVNELAAKASAMHERKPSSAKSWASKLAASLTRPND